MDSVKSADAAAPAPQEKMFILVALFQYSGWIGDLDPNPTYPRDFEVDYAREYEPHRQRRPT